jgi:hypothetical protein
MYKMGLRGLYLQFVVCAGSCIAPIPCPLHPMHPVHPLHPFGMHRMHRMQGMHRMHGREPLLLACKRHRMHGMHGLGTG